jgi:hypothetical protein
MVFGLHWYIPQKWLITRPQRDIPYTSADTHMADRFVCLAADRSSRSCGVAGTPGWGFGVRVA